MLTTVTGSSGRTPVTRAPRWRSSSLANATPPGAVPWCLGIKSLCYILLRTEGKRRGSQLTQCSIRNCICGTVRTQPPNGLNGSAISSRTVLRTAYAAVVATLNVWITEHKGRWRASVPAERTAGSRRRGLRWHRCCGARWSGETGRCLRHESAIPERPGRTHHQVMVAPLLAPARRPHGSGTPPRSECSCRFYFRPNVHAAPSLRIPVASAGYGNKAPLQQPIPDEARRARGVPLLGLEVDGVPSPAQAHEPGLVKVNRPGARCAP